KRSKRDWSSDVCSSDLKGYAISYEERVKGAVSISSPIFDPLMNIIATLTILIPTVRIDDYNIESLINSIVSGSNEITEKLNVTRSEERRVGKERKCRGW